MFNTQTAQWKRQGKYEGMRDKEVNDILWKFEKQEYPLVPILENDIDFSDIYKLVEKITENVNFEYLTNDLKLIKRVENVKAEFTLYALTSKGRSVLRQGGWLKYLKKKEEIQNKKELKQDYELKIVEFQAKNPRLPYYIALGSFILAMASFIKSCSTEERTLSYKQETKLYKKEQPILQNNNLVDSTKVSKKK